MERGSVLIVTRNNKALSKLAVNSALGQDMECDVLVIDNQSSDGTVAWLRTKPVALIANPKQLSLAACWNMGIRMFWRMGRTDCLVLNNDLVIREDHYRLLRAVPGPFVTAVSVNREDQLGTSGDRTAEDLAMNARPCPDYSCYLIRKSVTNAGIWFNEECYPAFYEDNWHHKMMHDKGLHAICVDLPFLHHGSQTVKNADEGEQARIKRGADRNREAFRRRYGCVPGTPQYEQLFSK